VKLLALAAAALVALIPVHAAASGADFVAASANPGATFATAADFNTVAVALTDPGTMHGTVTLAATAESDRGVASIRFQTSPAGAGAWTDACTATTSPYACAFDTTKIADGLTDVRATATDAAGYTRTATLTSRRIDNTAPATALTDPGTPLSGTKTLAATATDAGSGLASVALQYRPAGGSSWTTICAAATCSLNTATLPDGAYDLRSLATDNAGNTSTSTVSARTIDNTAPTATLADPGTPLSGPVTLTATATDAGSGVAGVKFEAAPAGTTTWTTLCTDATSAYSCAVDTTTLADGLYDLHAIATDAAGNTVTATVTGRRIDNNGPVVALTDPGSPIRNTASIAATATDPAGVASVKLERKLSSGSTWTTVCTVNASPYACPLTGLADGTYDFRATATDALGHSSTATLAARTLDSTAPKGSDIQAINGTGSTAKKIDAGDVITFKLSEPLAPASILAGWTGTSTPVSVHVNDAGTLDTLNVYDAANTTKLNLGDVALKADRTSASVRLAATMTMSGSTITLTLGASSGSLRTASGTTPMVWTPSTAATDLAGNAMSATAVTETGTDADF
jgi:Bacterial Ig domain